MTTATSVVVALPLDGSRHRVQLDVSDFRDEHKVPAPKYRHAAPSAPWPWMDFNRDITDVEPPSPGAHPWSKYPQSHFGNWTPDQVKRCRMLTICKGQYTCHIHRVDVFKDGKFDKPDEQARTRQIDSDDADAKTLWDELEAPLDGTFRVRALFVENITENVLQVLGARYNIEPFFFASSANWIPSRYQENPRRKQGDHSTVVLPFIRTVINQQEQPSPTASYEYVDAEKGTPAPITDTKQTIDTQAPLVLSSGKVLLQDLLAIHMVRSVDENIIISYHHNSRLQKTTARLLRCLVQRTGDSVYWQKLYEESRDPTFVFLAILWYALYAWDEALEVLYAHLSGELEAESKADATTHIKYSRELRQLQAHLLYYQQLLRDFTKSVEFVRDTRNPAMSHESITQDDCVSSAELLKQEANNLLSEIERLETQEDTVKAAAERHAFECCKAFSTINIQDSKRLQQDSAAMKQISYLTMIFLPASYLASVFGMNVVEINPGTLESLGKYVVSTIILTVITAWVVVALQGQSPFHRDPSGELRGGMARLAWPFFNVRILMRTSLKAVKSRVRGWRKATTYAGYEDNV